MQQSHNELDKFIKITENEEKASENLYKLVHEIAVTQNNNYVEMLRALVENPTASCIEINIEDKNNLSSLVASLILSMWHLEKRDDLPEEYKKIFEKIVELQPPAQHEMGLSSSVQPQPEPISFQTECRLGENYGS